jgi:hypothetical protein
VEREEKGRGRKCGVGGKGSVVILK